MRIISICPDRLRVSRSIRSEYFKIIFFLVFSLNLAGVVTDAFCQNNTIGLTDLEQEWLKEHRDLRVGVDAHWPPFDYVSEDGKVHQGMASDVIAILNQRLGISMKMVPDLSWQQVMKGLKKRDIDLAACLIKTPERSTFLNFTRSYLSFPWVLITRKKHPIVSGIEDFYQRKVAVVEGYAIAELIKSNYPDVEILHVMSPLDGLNAVATGRVEAYAGNLAVVSYTIAERHLANLKVASPVGFSNAETARGTASDRLRIGVRNDWPLLAGILDKGLQSISQEELNKIKSKWFSVRFEHKASNEEVIKIILKTAFVASVLLGLVLYWNRKLKGEVMQRKRVQQELIIAKQQAEKANHAKSEFLANMSHEIRTPMNAVLGFTDILRGMENDSKKVRYIEMIQTSGKSLLNLINNILDLSRIESGKMELKYSSISLSSFCYELNTIFSQQIHDKGLSFEFELAENIPQNLILDETRLRQVFVNLLGNALKFTHSGYIKLGITFQFPENSTQSRVNLIFSVSDSGIGIPEEQINKIFCSFEQIKGQKMEQYGGTGLGLTITKQIVELIGGTITVESELDTGTTFTLFIPDVEIAPEAAVPKCQDTINASTLTFAPATILIADDINYNLEILSTFLADWDFKIHLAGNGEEVLKKTIEIIPDIILLDMKMPVMDGYQVSAKLKESKTTRKIPIIAITASALKQDEEVISEICDDFLGKPVNKNNLIKKLMKFLPHNIIKKEVVDSDNSLAGKTGSEPSEDIPKDLVTDMREAIESGDMDRLMKLIEQVTVYDKILAKRMCTLADRYEYEALLNLL